MLNLVFLIGLGLFVISSAYFFLTMKDRGAFNPAFLVSFITVVSYLLMWQGGLTVVTDAGQPIFWTRWVFYALSCTLLMVEIGAVKGIKGGALIQQLYLTAIVMVTGALAALDLSAVRWAHFVISSVAYVLLVLGVIRAKTDGAGWVNSYIYFGWTGFPLVFLLAPTGFGVIGAAAANLLYLALDIYTKILFNIQLAGATKEDITA